VLVRNIYVQMAGINFHTAQIGIDTPPVNTLIDINSPIPSFLLTSRGSVLKRQMEGIGQLIRY
jgi:hypothetical protein